MANFQNLIANNTTLEVINLSNNNIGRDIESIRFIVEGLKKNTAIREIDLSYTNMDTEGIKKFISLLDTNDTITSLYLNEYSPKNTKQLQLHSKLRLEIQTKITRNKDGITLNEKDAIRLNEDGEKLENKHYIEALEKFKIACKLSPKNPKYNDNKIITSNLLLSEQNSTESLNLNNSTEINRDLNINATTEYISQAEILQSIIMDQTQPITAPSTPKSSRPSPKKSLSLPGSPIGSQIKTIKKHKYHSETQTPSKEEQQNDSHTNELKDEIKLLQKENDNLRNEILNLKNEFKNEIYQQMQEFQERQARKYKADKKKQKKEHDKKLAALEKAQQNLEEQFESKKLEAFEKFQQNLVKQLENNNLEITDKMKNDMQEMRDKMKNLAEKEDIEKLDKQMTKLEGTTKEALEASISSMKEEVTTMVNNRVKEVISSTNENILSIKDQIVATKDIAPEVIKKAENMVKELNYMLNNITSEMNISTKEFKKYNKKLMVGDEINIKLLHFAAFKEYLVKSVVTDAKKEMSDFLKEQREENRQELDKILIKAKEEIHKNFDQNKELLLTNIKIHIEDRFFF